MKFIKSGFAKKIIIILIALMIFNIAIPPEVKAWDVAGILMKPLTSLILVILVSVDATLGVFLTATDMLMNGIGNLISELCSENPSTSISINGKTILADKILVGPDTIFTGQVGILDANIFKANVSSNGIIQNSNVIGSIKEGLAETYVVLRNVCATLMLAGLIFTGIRMLVSSNIPNKKAAWLGYLQDWLIGMVLLIFSHIIMIGIFYVSDLIVTALRSSMVGSQTNLNWELVKQCFLSIDAAEEIVCVVMLGYLIYLTVIFAVAYFKRLMWICVLIVIAPIVSIMYAFGNQTKQIYSKWIREYIMTVLVQPFHMIIYYTLFSVPLNMTGSNGFTLTGSNIFTLIYALGAISFIRPAEKYVRELFGMHQGIANVASFDSGKQTVDAVVDVVKDVMSKIAAAVAVVATAGVAAPVVGAAEAGTAAGVGAAEGTGVTTALGEGITTGTLENMNSLGTPESSLIDAGLSGQTDPILDQYSSDGFGQNIFGEYFNPDTDEYDADYDPHKDPRYKQYDNSESEGENNDNQTENIDSTGEAKEKLEEERINAANVTITAGNVKMHGKTEEEKDAVKSEEQQVNKEESEENKENTNEEDPMEITKGQEKNKLFNPVNPLSEFMKVATGQKGLFTATQGVYSGGLAGTIAGRFKGEKFEKIRDLANKLDSKEEMRRAKRKTFEDIGGMQSLHKGFNEIRDTFYVGPAPGDWKKSDDRMVASMKAKEEQVKFNVVNNKGAQNYIIKQELYMEKLRAQYPDKQKYPDAYLKGLAEEKAKSKLKSLSDTYVPLGIKDPQIMYQLDKDRKQYGLTAEEAIQQRAAFEKFNINQHNVNKVNIENKPNARTVTDVIPNARQYFNQGYNNPRDMAYVNVMDKKLKAMATKHKDIEKMLEKTSDLAIQIDKSLSKKGGSINYKGNDPEVAKLINEINDHYKDKKIK